MIRSKQEFVEKANQLHKGVYDYSKFEYVKSVNKSTITCKKHGDFIQSANKHLMSRGCPKCGLESASIKRIKSKKAKVESILQKKGLSISSKNNKELLKNKDKVIFECVHHGEFISTIDSITSKGSKCPKCTIESNPYRNNKMGDDFFKRKVEQKRLEEVYFYMLHLEGNSERFLKFGVTTNLSVRFTKKLPYEIISIKFILLNTDDALHMEDLCKSEPQYRYTPKVKFGGYTECATLDLIGYCILICKENNWKDFSEFMD